MVKIALVPVLILSACLLAAAYGALHNQISYTVGPDYFHAFKFIQFNIAPALPYRMGAAIVGVQASWWMGMIIGLPIALICARAPNARQMTAVFARAALLVMGLTLALGMATLLVPPGALPGGLIDFPPGVQDQPGFLRAALLHDVSYLAGVVGLVAGLGYAWRATRR